MRDEDFEYFIEKFGEATHKTVVPEAALVKWKDKLPDVLLTYWKEEGWCGYADGLFWIVDPDEYEDIVDEWLHDSPLEQIDAFHVIARDAFGKLHLCGERTGSSATLSPVLGAVFALQSDLRSRSKKEKDNSIYATIGLSRDSCDRKDEARQPLFERALKLLGPLAPEEMYGFEPARILGGPSRLENLRKVNLDVHLTILRQLGAPSMPFSNIDVEKLLKS